MVTETGLEGCVLVMGKLKKRGGGGGGFVSFQKGFFFLRGMRCIY